MKHKEIIKQVNTENSKEKLKLIFKNEYKKYIEYSKKELIEIEKSIIKVIKGENDSENHIFPYFYYLSIERSKQVAQFYEEFFGEKIE